MENINKMDRRTRKTKKAIKEAFMTLISKNDISKITIKEISELADINRKTFYAHYSDVYAVVDDIENDIVERFVKLIDDNDIAKMGINPYELFKQLTQLINEDMDFYALFVNATILNTMLDKIKIILKDKLIHVLAGKTTADAVILNYIIDFIAAGLMTAYREWFNSDREVSLEELSNQLSLIVANGITPIIK